MALLSTELRSHSWEQSKFSRVFTRNGFQFIIGIWLEKHCVICKIDLPLQRCKQNIYRTLYLRGTITIRMAFSCTCQPNKKEPKAQRTRQRRNPVMPDGLNHTCHRAGWKRKRNFQLSIERNQWFCFSFNSSVIGHKKKNKLATPSLPIRIKTTPNFDLITRVFPRFQWLTCYNFGAVFNWVSKVI